MSDRVHTMQSSRFATPYIGAIVLAGAWVLGISLRNVSRTEFGTAVMAWAALSLLTLLAGRFTVRLPFLGCRVSISDAFVFLSVFLFGVDLATLTAAIDGYAASARQKGTWVKRLFNMAGMAISIHVAGRLFVAIQESDSWGVQAGRIGGLIVPALFLGAAQFVMNTAIVSAVVRLKEGVALTDVWRNALRWTGTAHLAGALAAAAVFVIIQHAGVISTVAILPFPAMLYFAYQTAFQRMQIKKLPVRS